MKMYLHLFTTAGVYLTASVINFDPAELFCWSSRVCRARVDIGNTLAGCIRLQTRHTQEVENPIIEWAKST